MATITGTAGNDTLTGTMPDPFVTGSGDDTITGLAGDDIIDGRGGADTLDGGDGNDTFRFTVALTDNRQVYSHIYGDSGTDTLDFTGFPTGASVSEVTDVSSGGNVGDLQIFNQPNTFASGIERIVSNPTRYNYVSLVHGLDVTGGSADDDLASANGGNLNGLGGNDLISVGAGGIGHGGDGNDQLTLTGAGQLFGDAGDDTLTWNAAVSGGLLSGGDGSDTLNFRFGDTIDLAARTAVRPDAMGGTIATTVSGIENLALDGNGTGQVTTLYGTDDANSIRFQTVFALDYEGHLYGRGGDDTLTGGGGLDILDGGTGNDVLAGNGGNNILYGGPGIDTAIISGSFADSAFTFAGDHVDITNTSTDGGGRFSVYTGVRGTDRLYGMEIVKFSDGTINDADGQPLVDDLYYDANNRDVFAAGADPDAHYAQNGWHEGRNPNAFFNTTAYLDANPDVARSGANPLDHYLLFGAAEGRDPSILFDNEQYLARNPDVAATGANPLQHYLEYGRAEGRAIYAAVGSHLIDAFDPEYYLLANPDVAAAGADPYRHYEQYGWREGRNPNAYFDTDYYLAHNPDVAAAGVDPLAHYELYGWHEGRDPSALFSTDGYLAANPDVAAADVDPLVHYLEHGRLEGRDPEGTQMVAHLASDGWLG